MSTADELILAIEALPEDEYKKLRRWFFERDWQTWDEQIEADSKSGKLDFIIKEAKNEKHGKHGVL